MERLSIIFSILFIIWFLLFNQQIIIQTTGFVLEFSEESTNEDLLVSTETGNFSNSTGSVENTTEIISEIENESSDDDVIELNVSDQKIITLGSTVTAVPKSKLALMFTKNNTGIQQPRDKQGKIFFDYNPIQFNYLLDQLRMIKRMPDIPAYELNIQAPNADIRLSFSPMISDLGLNPDQFLLPSAGIYLNLTIDSLIGWQECYRSTYDTPFDLLTFIMTCRSRRLLVACNPVGNKQQLTLAGVGKWEDILEKCSSKTHCLSKVKDDTSFYYVEDQAWGFGGYPKGIIPTDNGYDHQMGDHQMGSHQMGGQRVSKIDCFQRRPIGGVLTPFNLSPCDTSDQYSEYRLCWSLRSNINRGGGDRCGSMKNLHNAANWERIVYRAV